MKSILKTISETPWLIAIPLATVCVIAVIVTVNSSMTTADVVKLATMAGGGIAWISARVWRKSRGPQQQQQQQQQQDDDDEVPK